MSDRFFLDAPPHDGRAQLTGDEARHVARVLRAKAGDEIVVFAGTGVEWPARIMKIGRDEVELEIGPARSDAAPAGSSLVLAVALPKGERQKWLVEKLTELGVDRLVPLVTVRGVAEATPAALARLRRTVIEASKQCGRNTLLEIAPPATPAELLARLDPGTWPLVTDPAGPPVATVPRPVSPVGILALVGPEGGFTTEEVAAAVSAGCTRASLGPHVLRIETAAVAAAATLGCLATPGSPWRCRPTRRGGS
jgi:16S rRNA (uracil1498-N3)-methyltransferase